MRIMHQIQSNKINESDFKLIENQNAEFVVCKYVATIVEKGYQSVWHCMSSDCKFKYSNSLGEMDVLSGWHSCSATSLAAMNKIRKKKKTEQNAMGNNVI